MAQMSCRGPTPNPPGELRVPLSWQPAACSPGAPNRQPPPARLQPREDQLPHGGHVLRVGLGRQVAHNGAQQLEAIHVIGLRCSGWAGGTCFFLGGGGGRRGERLEARQKPGSRAARRRDKLGKHDKPTSGAARAAAARQRLRRVKGRHLPNHPTFDAMSFWNTPRMGSRWPPATMSEPALAR